MKPTEFTNWLQGAFEFLPKEGINQTQTELIKSKLSEVKTDESSIQNYFCTWLKGFFDMVEPVAINQEQIEKIKEKLNSSLKPVVESSRQPFDQNSRIMC